jgi:toxin YoeB
MIWKCDLTKEAKEDFKLLEKNNLVQKVEKLLIAIEENPFVNPPPCEKLGGHSNRYARRINIKHRLVYEVYKKERTIKVLRMWTHYGDN